MKFNLLVGLALPAFGVAQNVTTTLTTTTTSAAPSATPDYLAICESQASSYTDTCPQCLYRCIGSSYVEQCYWSTFFAINSIQAQCEAQGGRNCRGISVNAVCSAS
ncbi:hypothetical protein DHEL01_v212223 [Diaporthe helianthi]|uniref:Uncharacterized protein n=1 Tax=Diaporthe helianthi TaxID=158607 RepID=A0A2P5HGK4_DIAHE|nr:hypothetical protein DHEL01_v212223 [Diaporthe helianthi]